MAQLQPKGKALPSALISWFSLFCSSPPPETSGCKLSQINLLMQTKKKLPFNQDNKAVGTM